MRLDVANRRRRCTFLSPFDRWSVQSTRRRPRVSWPQRALALLAGHIARDQSFRVPSAAAGADIDILPYQLEPALAIAAGDRRILIADEVGLGKTIQAGLAIADLIHRVPSSRALIVVPAGIGEQWRDELTRRFQIDCRFADAENLSRASRMGARGDSPWRRPGVWIASADYLKQPHVMAGLLLETWDLVAIDEAHTVSGPSERHRACHELARRSRRLLLVSATPHQGDEAAWSRLLNIGRLEPIEDAVRVFRRTRADVGFGGVRRIRWHRLAPALAEQRVFDALLGYERAVLRAAGSRREEAAMLLLSVLRKRAFSTVAALASSIERRLTWLDAPARAADQADWLQPQLSFEETSDVAGDAETAALQADIGLQVGHERSWLRRLQALARAAERHDSKIAHLARLVARSREPVVVFTEFRHSLEVVRRAIGGTRRVAVLHGGLAPAERQQALVSFLAGDSTALVATDVAGQGLNLQSGARWLINLELPWNPARLEQRAGRLDRIGQRRSVHVTMLVSGHEAESGVLARLSRRALAARRALGAGVFDVAVPDEARLRAAILTGVDLDVVTGDTETERPRDGEVAVCRRWERPARFVARQLNRRRRLATYWQGPFIPGSRPAVARRVAPSDVARTEPRSESLLLFSASIVDRSGVVLERRPIAMHVPVGLATLGRCADILEAARQHAASRLSARVRRLNRLLQDLRHREAACDRAIDDVMAAAEKSARSQPGLFHHHESSTERYKVNDREETSSGVTVGPVILAVAIEGRP